jgi:hypothetical protein
MGGARGAVAIDLVDVSGDAIDFAHRVVHRLSRAIGLNCCCCGGLLRLCRGRLRAIGGLLRSVRLFLRLPDLRGRGATSGSAEGERNCEDGRPRRPKLHCAGAGVLLAEIQRREFGPARAGRDRSFRRERLHRTFVRQRF